VFTGTLNGKAGEVVAPAGNPEIATVTDPENPFLPTAETVTVELELPAAAVTVAGETTTSKSLGAMLGGGGVDPLPQPMRFDNDSPMQTMSREPE
jgi:hypothetical protein